MEGRQATVKEKYQENNRAHNARMCNASGGREGRESFPGGRMRLQSPKSGYSGLDTDCPSGTDDNPIRPNAKPAPGLLRVPVMQHSMNQHD